jgi:hypothetical protein
MSKEPNKVTEDLEVRQTVQQTNHARELSSSGEHKFSINSDQTLKNTMVAKELLKR